MLVAEFGRELPRPHRVLSDAEAIAVAGLRDGARVVVAELDKARRIVVARLGDRARVVAAELVDRAGVVDAFLDDLPGVVRAALRDAGAVGRAVLADGCAVTATLLADLGGAAPLPCEQGRPGLRVTLRNASSATGREEAVVLTAALLDGNDLFYSVGVAPVSELGTYRQALARVNDSVRLR